jgi:pullulanase
MSIRSATHSIVFRLIAVSAVLLLVLGMPWFTSVKPAFAGTQDVQVTIHYFRWDNTYTNWDNWIWDAPNGTGNGYEFQGTDSFGVTGTWTVPCTPVTGTTDCTQLGFIVRTTDWSNREPPGNRLLNVVNGKAEVWVISGDPNNYLTLADALKAKQPRILAAFLDGPKKVTVGLSGQYPLDGAGSGFKLKDMTTNKVIKATGTQDGSNFPGLRVVVTGDFQTALGNKTNWDNASKMTQMKQVAPDLYRFTANNFPGGSWNYKVVVGADWNSAYPGSNVALVTLSRGPVTFWYVPSTHDVFDSIDNSDPTLPNSAGWKTNDVQVTLKSAPSVTHTLKILNTTLKGALVTPRRVLDAKQYYYGGSDLGSVWTKKATTFRLWAPVASKVTLSLFKSDSGPSTATVKMNPSRGGTWYGKVRGNVDHWFYLYNVTNEGVTSTALDPYARNTAPNGTRAQIVDLSMTNPTGWSKDRHVGVPNPVDASIYEANVRDFSIDPNSGNKYPGKYLAFTQRGTTVPGTSVKTGLDSVVQLGVKDVEIMPSFEYASVDETNPTQQNWGYDPRAYNTPAGQYATDAHGTARITQYKQMVRAIHKAGLGYIMDVVYNHTADTSIFNNIVPGYYYRTDDFGNYNNGSGIGNEVATDRPQVFKFAEDSMKYWITQYHVDGFRMDQMYLFGKTQLTRLTKDLRKLVPGLVITGEPWGSAASGLTAGQQVTEGNQAGVGVAVWNDHFRNAICCDPFNESYQGFATGGTTEAPAVKNGVVGSIKYSDTIGDFAAAPSETMNYVTSHDNWTLWDRIHTTSNSSAPLATQISMDELAQGIIFTSQGVPMMLSGEEMLRSKNNDGNSYKSGDAVNQIDWALKQANPSVFGYYAGLNHLRDDHPAFRMTTAAQIKSHLTFLSSPTNTVAFELTGHANGDAWNNITVIYNPNSSTADVTLPNGSWNVVGSTNVVGETTLSTASTTAAVPAYTMEVLYQ